MTSNDDFSPADSEFYEYPSQRVLDELAASTRAERQRARASEPVKAKAARRVFKPNGITTLPCGVRRLHWTPRPEKQGEFTCTQAVEPCDGIRAEREDSGTFFECCHLCSKWIISHGKLLHTFFGLSAGATGRESFTCARFLKDKHLQNVFPELPDTPK